MPALQTETDTDTKMAPVCVRSFFSVRFVFVAVWNCEKLKTVGETEMNLCVVLSYFVCKSVVERNLF